MTVRNETYVFPEDSTKAEKLLRIISVGPNSFAELQVIAGTDFQTVKTYDSPDTDIVDTLGKSFRIKVKGQVTYQCN